MYVVHSHRIEANIWINAKFIIVMLLNVSDKNRKKTNDYKYLKSNIKYD